MHHFLRQCQQALAERLEGLSPTEAEAPHGNKWSIAGIVEHLDLTYTRSAAGLARRIAKGPEPERRRNLRQRIAQTIVTGIGYFPAGRESPSAVVPQGRSFVEVRAGLEGHLIELDARLAEAERAFGPRVTVLDHPILGPFTVNQWRKFHWVHTRHHLRQIHARSKERRP